MKKHQKFIATKKDVLCRKINCMEEFKSWRETPREWPFGCWTWMILCVFHAMYTPHLNIRSLSFIPRTSQLSNVSWITSVEKRRCNLEAGNLKRPPTLLFLLSALPPLRLPLFSWNYIFHCLRPPFLLRVCVVWMCGGKGEGEGEGEGSCKESLYRFYEAPTDKLREQVEL